MKSARQEKSESVLSAIQDLINEKGYPPTRAEISRKMGWKSANSAQVWLERLQNEGRIKIEPDISRGIAIVSREAENRTHVQ